MTPQVDVGKGDSTAGIVDALHNDFVPYRFDVLYFSDQEFYDHEEATVFALARW